MRRLTRLTASLAILAAAACSNVGLDDPTSPRPTLPSLQTVAVTACTPKTASEIEALITDLFFKNQWPDPNSALSKFNNIKALLAAGSTQEAQFKTRDLVRFIENKFSNLTPEQKASTQDEMDTLVVELYCFVGISGTVYDLNPGDPAKAFVTPGGTAGVWFPPNSVPVGTMVVLEDITALYACPSGIFCGTSPLDTPLDKYPTYVAIQLIPNTTFSGTILPVVAVCFPANTPLDVADDLLVGHQGGTGFEILPETTIPSELLALLNCPDILTQQSAPPGILARLMAPIANAFLPQPLQARMRRLFGGAGGSAEEFSPFGAVDASLAGAGGSAEEFSRAGSKSNIPMASVVLNGTPTVTGAAGTTATTGLPKVTVKTRGQDDNGVDPVAGVKVIFSVKAAAGSSPAGNGHLCAVGGVVPATVEVITNSSGEATLPCFDFGTTVGYNNIKAAFDPSSLTFPGAGQVFVVVNGSTDNSVNFLSHTDAGPAYAIEIVEGNTKSGPAYAAVTNPQPKVRVTDLYGNNVPGQLVSWTASYIQLSPPSVDPSSNLTQTDGTAAVTSWILGPGANTLLAEISTAAGLRSVTFNGTGTITLDLANACATGGAKDDITKYGFYAPRPNKAVGAIGLNLSSNGAPGTSENYEITVNVSINGGTTFPYSAKARLQSSSNASKGVESLVLFDFKNTPIPTGTGNLTVRMSAASVTGGTPQPLPANRAINMNTGPCAAGSKSCKGTVVQNGVTCNINESQLTPFVLDYRKGLAARIYVIR